MLLPIGFYMYVLGSLPCVCATSFLCYHVILLLAHILSPHRRLRYVR